MFVITSWPYPQLADIFVHPDQREVSGVKFSTDGTLVYVSCLSGALTILKLDENTNKMAMIKSISCQKDFGEIYSLAVDDNLLLTGHTLTTTSVLVWNLQGTYVFSLISQVFTIAINVV